MTTAPTLRAGMRSLAIALPSVLRTNDYFRQAYPEMVAQAEQYSLAKLWGADDQPSAFDRTMAPYLSDPFRGAVERRLRAPDEPALAMEVAAAREALEAAGLSVDDVDLVLVSSFVGDRFGVGNAAYLAERLGLRAPAVNIETACSSSVVGLQLAGRLLAAGNEQRALVVVSTSNSVQVVDDDTLGWFVGDGAGAFVVEPTETDHGILGWKTINSVDTNDMFVIQSIPDRNGGTRLCTVAHERAGAMARDVSESYLRECVEGALTMARLSASDVDYWIFNTPNAWYADFCASVLGIDEDHYQSVYPRYANIGAALMPATLYHALDEGRIRPGDIVGMYSLGSTSTASALISRLGDVALGRYPARPAIVQ